MCTTNGAKAYHRARGHSFMGSRKEVTHVLAPEKQLGFEE